MNKIKWLSADWGVSTRQLASAMKEWHFTDQSDEGFVVDRLRRESIEARYVRKDEVAEIIVDPFGKETSFSTVKYQEQPFLVVAGSRFIEFRRGVRCVQPCLSLLSQVTDFRLAVHPVKVDVAKWLVEFERLIPFPVAVDAFQIGGILFPDGASARALVKAGVGDAYAAMKSVTAGRPHVVEKVRVKHRQVGRKGTLVLSSTCMVTTSGFSIQDDTLVQDALRDSLALCVTI